MRGEFINTLINSLSCGDRVSIPMRAKRSNQCRPWKGYRFEVLDELQKQDLIYQVPGGKSLYLYLKGKRKNPGIDKEIYRKK